MPTINTLKKTKKEYTRNEHTPNRDLRRKAYGSTEWRKLRDWYMKQHPICEECLKNGKVTPAEDIHHVKSPFLKGEINWALLLDADNLKPLCKRCHANLHNKQLGHISPQDVIKQLEDLLNENITDEEIESGYGN